MAFPTSALLDNFNRANEGPPPSANWVTDVGYAGLIVASNACTRNAASSAGAWNTSFVADQEIYADLIDPTDCSLNIRLVTANNLASNHYQLYFVDETTLELYKSVATVFTQLGADITVTHVDGDQWGIECIGTTIKVYQNGVEVASRTDSDVSGAGYIGASLRAAATIMDDFGGGAVVAAGGDVRQHIIQAYMRTA
jgi:hypothetical protein